MNAATPTPKMAAPPVRTPTRGLPLLVSFDGDEPVRQALARVQRFRRASYETLDQHPPEVDRVLVTSSENMLHAHLDQMHTPNLRVIALSELRFKDPRTDGAVYAYVTPGTPTPLLERMVDNALDHIHLVATRQGVNERLAFATREINELNRIGAALSAEHDTGKLLELILTKCREITCSDAGSLYLAWGEDEQNRDAEPEARGGESGEQIGESR